MSSDGSYQGIVAESYDIWFSGDKFDDMEFYKKLIKKFPGVALEIGCGTGRLILPYLQEGLEIEGVDSSEEMLNICRVKADQRELSPVLYEQYMQNLTLPKKYSTIFIPLASFMLVIDRQEAMAALEKLFIHLEEGGQIIIPLFIPKDQLSNPQKNWSVRRVGVRSDGAKIVLNVASEISFNEQIQTNWNRYEIYNDDILVETKFTTSQLRWYYKHEFSMMLEQVGFNQISVYGGYNFNQLNNDQSFIIFRARK
jgi:ubiquinone/menaquinone biosynthesis C-methylase UbiE